jgi:Tfp pilus assembly protein PilE
VVTRTGRGEPAPMRDGTELVPRNEEVHETSRGSTLVEVLVVVIIVGCLVVAIMKALGTTESGSRVHRSAATTDVVIRDYAESLKIAVTQTGAWCKATPYTVTYAPPTGFSVSQTVGSCPVNNATTPQFQTVTLTATSTSSADTETVRVVVRKP